MSVCQVSTLVLVPQCVDLAKGRTNYFGKPVAVVAAGGIMDGRGVACAMALGAAGCWCGTRFLTTPEANAPDLMKVPPHCLEHCLLCKHCLL